MKHILRMLWLCKMALVESRRWHGARRDGTPRVFYGHDKLPSRSDHASGGIIKCQDLEEQFPNETATPNLLYLVSSALPPHLPVLLRAARRAGCPIVLNQNGVAYPAWCPRNWEVENRPLALAYHAADYIFWQSEFCRISADKYLGTRPGPGEILHNPVDTTVFTPAPARAPHAPVLLVSGSHMFRYRLETAVRALAEVRLHHRSVRMIVAGRYCWGPDESACRREIQTIAASAGVAEAIDWRGGYSQAEAPALMREADILLHPKYNDPCPRLVVEALSCGLPVVYSHSGGVPELVGPDAGVGVPAPADWEQDHPPSASQLATTLIQVIRNLPALSAAARQRATSALDVRQWRDRHVAIFKKLITP